MFVERFLALTYLRSKEGAGFAFLVNWFSFAGIALGVATLIIVTSVMNGFRSELLDKIVGMKGHIVVSSSNASNIDDYPDVVNKLKLINGINNIIPQIEEQTILLTKGCARGVMLHGISMRDLVAKRLISTNIRYGSIKHFEGHRVLIGKRMSESLGVRVGDSVRLFIPDGVITPFGNLPKEETFDICGIFEVGMNEYDKNIIIIPLDSAQSVFNVKGDGVRNIEVFVDNADHVSKTTKKIADALGPKFAVLDWKHSDASIFHAVVVEKNVMTLILSIIVLVAVFNIISGLSILTISKTRDIAILRMMGLTKKAILKIFFYIGSLIGVMGTLTGVVLGLLVSLNIDSIKRGLERLSHSSLFSEEIYFLSQIPSKTEFLEVSFIVLFSLTLCFLATIYPAIRASRVDPVEILRT
jgi:lipoprotein-releasing system permease protein